MAREAAGAGLTAGAGFAGLAAGLAAGAGLTAFAASAAFAGAAAFVVGLSPASFSAPGFLAVAALDELVLVPAAFA